MTASVADVLVAEGLITADQVAAAGIRPIVTPSVMSSTLGRLNVG